MRSYCAGRGRITRGQKRALNQWRSRYLIDAKEIPPYWQNIFCRDAPLIVEVGCGYGETTADIATQNPACDYAAFEIYQPGIGALMNTLAARAIDNIRIICADAARFLPLMFAPHSLAAVHIFFPDPWPKRRHHKRRLINANFAATLADALTSGGKVRIATDDLHYATAIDNTFDIDDRFLMAQVREDTIPQTRFAARAAKTGREVKTLTYKRI